MKYLIGSRALDPSILKREPKDWDFIDTEATEVSKFDLNGEQAEIHPWNLLNNSEICEEYAACTVHNNGVEYTGIHLKGLAILKRSHLHRPLNFEKHIRDYHNIKAVCGAFNDKDKEILKRRIKLTKEKYKDRTPSLMKSNDEFFDDFVKKYYIHDQIHEVVAHEDRPMYEKLKVDMSQAFCERDLWNQLTHEQKVFCVREEAFVISLERFIIPEWIEKGRNYPAAMAFDRALTKICTTLTSGYFRWFATENWPEIKDYKVDFVKKFKESGLERVD